MREAIARAQVGDDVYGEDPTTNRLQELAADLTGKEAALFVPSGTMANQVAVRSHTQPGDAALVGEGAHVDLHEAGAAAALSGVRLCSVGRGGFFGAADVLAALHPDDEHYAPTRLVCVENTHNQSGGRVFPFEDQTEIAQVAHERGLALHLDGARLFNAAAASGRSARELAAPYDSISFCLSKGLGAPAGSLICGARALVQRAHRFRKMFGGGMRQAGILAAAGIYALEHHTKRLVDDHTRARRLGDGLAKIPGLDLVAPPETNMVLFRSAAPAQFAQIASAAGLGVLDIAPGVFRAVTHLDVDDADIDVALEIAREAAR